MSKKISADDEGVAVFVMTEHITGVSIVGDMASVETVTGTVYTFANLGEHGAKRLLEALGTTRERPWALVNGPALDMIKNLTPNDVDMIK